MRQKLASLCVAFLSMNLAAHADAEYARELYIKASEMIGEGRATSAVPLLRNAIREMGSTNLRLQSALVQAMTAQSSDNEFEAEYAKLDSIQQGTNFDWAQEITSRHAGILAARQQDETDWHSAQSTNTSAGYAAYLTKHPTGRFSSSARSERDSARAREAEAARIEAERQARIREQKAKEEAERQDRLDFDKATRSGEIGDFEWYLKTHPAGLFRDPAEETIRTKKIATCDRTIAFSLAEIEQRKSSLSSNRIWMLLMAITTGAGATGVVYGLPKFFGDDGDEVFLGSLIALPSAVIGSLSIVSMVNTSEDSDVQESGMEEASQKLERARKDKEGLLRRKSASPSLKFNYAFDF